MHCLSEEPAEDAALFDYDGSGDSIGQKTLTIKRYGWGASGHLLRTAL